MLRQQSLITILSLLATNACFSGLYIGAGIGPEGAQFKQVAHVKRTVSPGNFDVLDTERFSGTGIFGTLFAGYALKHNQYYLAGEVNANLSSVEYELINNEYLRGTFLKDKFAVKHSVGVSLLPGIFLTESLIGYGRIGYANGRVKINDAADPTVKSSTSNRDGIRYGAGIRYSFNNQWSLMMDYSQINYRKIKSYTFESFGGVSKDAKIYPYTAQVAFGLIYSFNA